MLRKRDNTIPHQLKKRDERWFKEGDYTGVGNMLQRFSKISHFLERIAMELIDKKK